MTEANEDVIKEEEVKEETSPAAPAGEVDTKSFEERLAALKKPDSVPEPNQDQVNDKLSKLNAQIEKCDKRLTDIKAALDKANQSRDKNKDETKGVIEQLKLIRAKMTAASREKEACFQQLRDMTAARQAQQKSLQELRKTIKFDDVGQVESRVKDLEAKIEQGQCADLRDEKRTIQEIRQLNEMKATITRYQSQRQTVSDDSETKSELERRKGEAVSTIEGLKKEQEKLEKLLEEVRKKQQTNGPSANDLWKEQKDLYTKIKEHRAEIRTVNNDFKGEMNKYRDYMRALGNFKRAQGKIQAEQRRAEWEARKAESNDPLDKDLPSDDPHMGHPWADEIYMCVDLEKVISSFLPKEVKDDASAEEPKEKAWMKGAAGKTAANDEDNAFASLAKPKAKKAAKKPSDSAVAKKVILTVDTINSLSAIGVAIPTTSDQVAACLEQLKAKKTEFEGMNEEEKKAHKKKVQQAKNNSNKAADGGLVSVDISASADKVKVVIDYPALSASA